MADGHFSAWRRPMLPNGNYATWVRNLKRKSGVYVIACEKIFSDAPGCIWYVGMSDHGRLYQTMTRHFQSWEGPQEHTVYEPRKVWVKVKICSRASTEAAERRTIKRLKPRDNILRYEPYDPDAEEEVPF